MMETAAKEAQKVAKYWIDKSVEVATVAKKKGENVLKKMKDHIISKKNDFVKGIAGNLYSEEKTKFAIKNLEKELNNKNWPPTEERKTEIKQKIAEL